MDFAQLIQTVAIYALPVVFAITLHEAAHGYAARHFGDNTAYMLGRITLNPLKHIDPMGTIVMPLVLYFATSGAFLFGYAKPVPVNFGRLRNPKRDMVWVALAGPGANLVQAIGWTVAAYVMLASGVEERFWLGMAKAGVARDLIPSPKKIDFILRTGGYWGQDIARGYGIVREAALKFKAGVVAVKVRRGSGRKSPMLLIVTRETWQRMNGLPTGAPHA